MSSFDHMYPGCIVGFMYDYNKKIVEDDDEIYSRVMKEWVQVGGKLLLISANHGELVIFHANSCRAIYLLIDDSSYPSSHPNGGSCSMFSYDDCETR